MLTTLNPIKLGDPMAKISPSSFFSCHDQVHPMFSGTVRFRNDQIVRIMGYGDYQLGNVVISRGLRETTNLYIISLDVMLKSSPICLLSKASKTKSWLCTVDYLISTLSEVRTNNGTEFVNQTLHEFYENVGISHQTSVVRTPQQNGVVKRRNWTLVEAARRMLIFSTALLFL
ncbi:integrase, catalytic region, zinc finger, CCHC-type containing protein [Tanacetum coccineum]